MTNKYYTHQWSFNGPDLYGNINPAKGNITTKFAVDNGFLSKRHLCGRVFVYFIYIVLLDLIENNITFEFPMTGRNEARFYVKCFDGEKALQLYARGAFAGIDLFKSEFKTYKLTYQGVKNKKMHEKPIYICNRLKYWFYDKINSGKQYY